VLEGFFVGIPNHFFLAHETLAEASENFMKNLNDLGQMKK